MSSPRTTTALFKALPTTTEYQEEMFGTKELNNLMCKLLDEIEPDTAEAKLAAKEKELAAAKHEIFCLNMKLMAEEILRCNYQRELLKLKRKLETEEPKDRRKRARTD